MSYFHKGNRMPLHRNTNTPPPQNGVFYGIYLPPGRTQRRIYDHFFVSVVSICTTLTEKSQSPSFTLSPTVLTIPHSFCALHSPSPHALYHTGAAAAAAGSFGWRQEEEGESPAPPRSDRNDDPVPPPPTAAEAGRGRGWGAFFFPRRGAHRRVAPRQRNSNGDDGGERRKIKRDNGHGGQ